MAGAIIQGAQALTEGIMAIVKLIKGKVAKEKEVGSFVLFKGIQNLTRSPDAEHVDAMAHRRGPEEDRHEVERARYSPQARSQVRGREGEGLVSQAFQVQEFGD